MAARKKGEALVYLRRSTDRQELSLQYQLEWAIGETAKLGVALDATLENLEYARMHGLHSYKAIRLDDGITGIDLARPGLRDLIATAQADTTISHVFAYKRDRIGRPENPLELAIIEHRLRTVGVTLILSDGVAGPLTRGQSDFGELITMLYGYQQSHDELIKLAERMIDTLVKLANDGYRTGGSAPYGFVRALVGPDDEIIEVLPPGKRVRQAGCHVRIIPDEGPEGLKKLAIRLRIVEWRLLGWGWKRIKNELNDMGIPSPASGTTRTDHGVKHHVSGKWNQNTIKNLCLGAELVGIQEFGRRSEGKLRRLSVDGPRLLVDDDRGAKGEPKTILNDASTLIIRSTGTQKLISSEKRKALLAMRDQRSKSQSGVPRVRDLADNPMSCRAIDMTDGCGWPMYARKSGKRRMLTCGRYLREGRAGCNHNQVDGDAAFRFVMRTLRQRVEQLGQRHELEKLLRQRATATQRKRPSAASEQAIAELMSRILQMQYESKVARRRILREEDDHLAEQMKLDYREMEAELRTQQEELRNLQAQAGLAKQVDPNADVAAAMRLFNEIERTTSDPSARRDAAGLFATLNVRLGLTFTGAKKGMRDVRRLQSGILALGAAELPLKLYGKDNAQSPHDPADRAPVGYARPEDARGADNEDMESMSQRDGPVGHRPKCPGEDVSYNKANRGDRI